MKKRRVIIILAIIIVILLLIACAVLYAMYGNPTENPSPSTDSTSGTMDATASGGTTTVPTSPDEAPTQPEPTDSQPTEPKPTETEPTEPEPTEPTHEHSYEATVVAPTCLEQGYTTYVCSCGDSYTTDITDATGHSWGEWEIVTEATEESTGLEQRSCLNCETVETKEIPVVIPDHTHAYTSEVTKTATCAAEGELTYTCSCGASYTETIPKTDHSYTSKVTASTCTAQGYTTYTCSACGHSYKDNYTDKTAHSYTSEVTEPTCTSKGYTTYTCSSCGDKYKDDYKDELDHSYVSEVVKPTCTAQGYTKHTCSVCGTSYKDSYTAVIAHTWSEWKTTKEPTTSAEGEEQRSCTVCGKTEKRAIDKLPEEDTHVHEYTIYEWRREPTCTSKGLAYLKCECGAYKSGGAQYVDALGHDYVGEVTKQVSCTQDEKTKYTCSRCNDSYTETTQKATGHVAVITETHEANCGWRGYYIERCVYCDKYMGQTYTTDDVTDESHKMKTWSVGKMLDTHCHQESNPSGTGDLQTSSNSPSEDLRLAYASIDGDDYVVDVCTVCGYIDHDTMRVYDAKQASLEMLGYVNELRYEVLGDHWYDLQHSDLLLEYAMIRAEMIGYCYTHGFPDDIKEKFKNEMRACNNFAELTGENISENSSSILGAFNSWRASPGHYNSMISKNHKYFAYATYWGNFNNSLENGYYLERQHWTERCLVHVQLFASYEGFED